MTEKKIRLFSQLLRYLLFGLLFSSVLYAQDVQQSSTSLMTIREQLYENLHNLKLNSERLNNELNELKKSEQLSQTKLTELSTSLDNMIQSYSICSQKLIDTENLLKNTKAKLTKLWIVTIIFLVLFVVVRVVIIFLKVKNVSIPYIVNTLL